MRERAPLRSAPLAARRFCLDCQGASPAAVRGCADTGCPLWQWRLPPGSREAQEADGPCADTARGALRAIRRQCVACAGGRGEVRGCAARGDCALWSYRFGVRPRTYRAVRRRFFAPRELDLPLAPAPARPGGAEVFPGGYARADGNGFSKQGTIQQKVCEEGGHDSGKRLHQLS